MSNEKAEEAVVDEAPVVFEKKPQKRDTDGLLEGIEYVYNELGTIDWRKMVPDQYLTPFSEKTDKTDIKECEDHELLILLNGFKKVAAIRGYTNIQKSLVSPSADSVSAVCHITWMPNYEQDFKVVTTAGEGDATPLNTSPFGRKWLTTIAGNRAFIRAVRNMLEIETYGFDEIDNDGNLIATPSERAVMSVADSTDPAKLLKSVMDEKGVTLEILRKRLAEENWENAGWAEIKDLPDWKIVELTGRIRKIPA